MNDEAAFLRAICEHPDEDTPRLVFADWLQEQGGPVNTAWANGIRAGVGSPRRHERRARAAVEAVRDVVRTGEVARAPGPATGPDTRLGSRVPHVRLGPLFRPPRVVAAVGVPRPDSEARCVRS